MALYIFLAFILSVTGQTGLSSVQPSYDGYSKQGMAVSSAPAMMMGDDMAIEMEEMGREMMYYPSPIPQPDTNVTNLETYETTDYYVSARTRQFDEFCSSVRSLKVEERFEFRSISENTNSCSATFYTAEENVDEVLNRFGQFSGVEISRTTNSVTRQKERLESQTNILHQQLASVERTLAGAEVQFDQIIRVAEASNDASELADAIREKLQMVDSLTQRKISLTSQINNLYRQAQDLDERIGVVQFSVNIQRSLPIYPNQDDRKWEQAWKNLGDEYTNTLIGLTSQLGVFLLKVVQYGVYLLILFVIVRFGWKFAQKLWRM